MASKDSRMDRSIGALLLGLVGVGLLIWGLYLGFGQAKRGGQHGVTNTVMSVASNGAVNVTGGSSKVVDPLVVHEGRASFEFATSTTQRPPVISEREFLARQEQSRINQNTNRQDAGVAVK
jgi:hypothetical protein